MKDIKLKSTRNASGYNNIDLAEDTSMLGLFAIAWSDPDGERGRELVNRWNEHEELVETLRQAQSLLATLIDPNSQHVSSPSIYFQAVEIEEEARALLAKIGGAA